MIKILVVEDDNALSILLTKMFTVKGCHVSTANDGHEALQSVYNSKPDMVILDVMLPGLDGIKVLKEMRMMKKDLPVIMLSSVHDESVIKEAGSIGASAYITKPFRAMELYEKVTELVLPSLNP